MNMRDRLRLLKAAGAARAEEERAIAMPVSPAPKQAAPAPHPTAPALQQMIHAQEPCGRPVSNTASGPRPFRLASRLEGYLSPCPSGEAYYTESRYPLAHRWGPLPLEHLFTLPPEAWERLGRLPSGVDLRRALFFDTETTGLAGGTGTYAFLVGLGFFDGHEFVVRQYFMRDYPEEPAMLEAIAADLSHFQALVSFNGKSFDWPLLETRFRLSRMRPPLSGAPHLDLLHPARRIWRDRLGACNLQNLEAEILGVHRQGDVPGQMIPALYFDYLRSGNAAPLVDVVQHNKLDILSLVSLAGWMGQMVTQPLGATPDGELLCGDDLYALGRLYESRGLLADCLSCYETARVRGTERVPEGMLLRQLANGYKRAQEKEQAVVIWEQMTASRHSLSLYPYVELAKYHEHVTHAYDLAEEMTRQALAVAEARRSLAGAYGPGSLREYQEVQHRLDRLQRKRSR